MKKKIYIISGVCCAQNEINTWSGSGVTGFCGKSEEHNIVPVLAILPFCQETSLNWENY